MSPKASSPGLDSIDDARKKITAETIRWITNHFTDLKPKDLAELLGADESTVKRWKRGDSRPKDDHFQQIRQLIEFKDLLEKLYGNNKKHLEEWIYKKSELLDGKMPHDLLKDERELEPVIQQLSSLVTGTHT